jgi:hypothetical protein
MNQDPVHKSVHTPEMNQPWDNGPRALTFTYFVAGAGFERGDLWVISRTTQVSGLPFGLWKVRSPA